MTDQPETPAGRVAAALAAPGGIERLISDLIVAKRQRFYAHAVELGIISKEQAFNLRILHVVEDMRARRSDEEAAQSEEEASHE